MTALDLISISELADAFGLSMRTLRIYEEKGLLSPVRHGRGFGAHGGARHYTRSDRERLRRIVDAKALGFTLAEIRDLLDREWAEDRDAPLTLSREEVVFQIAQMEAQKASAEAALVELRRRLLVLNRAS